MEPPTIVMTEFKAVIGAVKVLIYNRNGECEGEYPVREDEHGRVIVFHRGQELLFDRNDLGAPS